MHTEGPRDLRRSNSNTQSEHQKVEPGCGGRVRKENFYMRYVDSITKLAIGKLNRFEAGLRKEMPRVSLTPASIATAQLLLDLQRARIRFELALGNELQVSHVC